MANNNPETYGGDQNSQTNKENGERLSSSSNNGTKSDPKISTALTSMTPTPNK